MNELFKVDLTGAGYQAIARWIWSCRHIIYQKHYSSYIEYANAAAEICAEWEKHYEANKSTYEDRTGKCTEVFQRALVYATFLDRVTCGIDFQKGKRVVPLSEISTLSRLSADKSFSIGVQSAIRDKFESYYGFLVSGLTDTTFGYKAALDKRIKGSFDEEGWYVYAERGREALAASSVAEFVVLYDKSYTLNCAVHTIKKHSYIEGLEANGISKTIYHEFMGFTHSEKAFDKKMFVNMAFLLGLSYPLAERLLNLNGYTFEGSERAFDKLCAKGFKLGFGRELTNALIDKRNIELGGDRIPNLQKNSKELNIAKLLAP